MPPRPVTEPTNGTEPDPAGRWVTETALCAELGICRATARRQLRRFAIRLGSRLLRYDRGAIVRALSLAAGRAPTSAVG